MKPMEIYENLQNTMKVLRGQEANLESTKDLLRGSRRGLAGLSIQAPKYMKMLENL